LRQIEAKSLPTQGRQSTCKSGGVSVVPAVALTAHARADDRDKALTAGFQAHLSKPVDPQRLVSTVATLCHSFDRASLREEPGAVS